MIVLLFCLMMLDYCLTKMGMSVQFITEGNLMMCWLMDLPFAIGFMAKTIISIVLIIPLVIAKIKCARIYKYAMIISFAAYAIVFALHSYWIYLYLTTR